MEINEFVEKIKEDGFENIEAFIKTNYIPVKVKRDIAIRTLEQCTVNDNGFIYMDKLIENVYFSMFMFNAYTGVEISEDFETLLEEYDKLCGIGVFDLIKDMLVIDYARAEKILSDEEDRVIYQNSAEASFAQIASSINENLTTLTDALASKIDGFDINSILPEGTDIDELLSTLDKLK